MEYNDRIDLSLSELLIHDVASVLLQKPSFFVRKYFLCFLFRYSSVRFTVQFQSFIDVYCWYCVRKKYFYPNSLLIIFMIFNFSLSVVLCS